MGRRQQSRYACRLRTDGACGSVDPNAKPAFRGEMTMAAAAVIYRRFPSATADAARRLALHPPPPAFAAAYDDPCAYLRYSLAKHVSCNGWIAMAAFRLGVADVEHNLP